MCQLSIVVGILYFVTGSSLIFAEKRMRFYYDDIKHLRHVRNKLKARLRVGFGVRIRVRLLS